MVATGNDFDRKMKITHVLITFITRKRERKDHIPLDSRISFGVLHTVVGRSGIMLPVFVIFLFFSSWMIANYQSQIQNQSYERNC